MLVEPPKSQGGFRYYDEATIARVVADSQQQREAGNQDWYCPCITLT